MEPLIVLLCVYLLVVLLVFPLWAFAKLRGADDTRAQLLPKPKNK